jgi:glycerophosphoryl diester phosphodiesterase
VLERYPDTPLLIELKEIEAQEPVRDELLRAGAADRVVVASFLHRALDLFRRPPFLVGASRRDIVALKLDSLVRRVPRDRRVVAYAVPYSYKNRIRVPTPRLLAAANQLQRPVHVWTVDDPGLARDLWRMGVAGVISNFPGRLRTVDRPATSSPSSDPPIL